MGHGGALKQLLLGKEMLGETLKQISSKSYFRAATANPSAESVPLWVSFRCLLSDTVISPDVSDIK